MHKLTCCIRAKAIQSQTGGLWGVGRGNGEEIAGARLSERFPSFPSGHMAQLASLGSSGGHQRLHSPSGSLSFSPKPLPQPTILSSPLSLSPQLARLSCWFFTLYEVLTVIGSFTNSLLFHQRVVWKDNSEALRERT